MASYKFASYYKLVAPYSGATSMTDNQSIGDQGTYANYTWYQRLVQGSASRLARYNEYDLMDNDIEIAMALDIIAEEMIGSNPNEDLPLEVVVDSEKDHSIKSAEVMTLKSALRYWNDIHDWTTRLFKVARVTAKYGDCFFVRRNHTSKWEYIHPKHVVAAVVDEKDITRVVGWQIRRDIKAANTPYNAPQSNYGNQSSDMVEIYPADEVVWFSLNDDISESAPFGDSVLRAVYRAQKQKELLEDAIVIYRIQRAPERRAFYINTGKLPPHRVKDHLERVKNEIRQRKIPTANGGIDQVDSVYNPMSMTEDFFFSQGPDGKGSRVEVLQGGQGLGELSDLEYFQWKVYRGLRIPLSYMKEGQENSIINDGKTGVAYIQEQRFALYIKRLQGYIARIIDKEFKRYVRAAGITIDPTKFHISLKEPENFGKHRQQQFDSELLSTYSQVQGLEHISKRFGLSRYLQWTDAEVLENERKRAEELGLDPDNITAEALKMIYASQADMAAGMGGMGGGMPPVSPMMAGTFGDEMGVDPSTMGPADMNGEMGAAAGGMVPPAPGGEAPPAPVPQ